MNIKMVEFIALLGPSLLGEYCDSPGLAQFIYLLYFLSLMDWWVEYKKGPYAIYPYKPNNYIGTDPIYTIAKPLYLKIE